MAMHLSSMTHSSGRERDAHDHHRHFQQPSTSYPPVPQSRPYESSASLYPASQPSFGYQQYHRVPQSPPSPPVEEQKPSLPSISSLLGIANSERAVSETAPSPKPSQQQQRSPQLKQEGQRHSTGSVQQQVENRADSAQHSLGPAIINNTRMTLPPTPPMQPDSVLDGNRSPSAASSHSSVSAAGPYFLGHSLNNVEQHQQRQSVPIAQATKRESVASQPSMSPYSTPQYTASPYQTSPGASSATSYFPPETQSYNSVGMYGQRPLPSNYQPQLPMPVQPNPQTPSGVWQHHHYISASSQSAFPQSQDRYICSTCNKAFSRPSSLRIHSHSHTGEKPYKCPQPGCGKAFSVRSNMKRHERGCHATANAAI